MGRGDADWGGGRVEFGRLLGRGLGEGRPWDAEDGDVLFGGQEVAQRLTLCGRFAVAEGIVGDLPSSGAVSMGVDKICGW